MGRIVMTAYTPATGWDVVELEDFVQQERLCMVSHNNQLTEWWIIRYNEDGTENWVDGYWADERTAERHCQEAQHNDDNHEYDLKSGDRWNQ